jgi:uncharacterized protein
LTDYYSLLYLKFIQDIPKSEAGNWNTLSQTQSWKSWSGYAFENICLQHIEKIKNALGISGVHSQQSSFYSKGDDENEGTQIDLVIDRNDNAITLCEMKFYNDDVVLNKENAEKLRRRVGVFRRNSETKKQIFLTFVTTFGLIDQLEALNVERVKALIELSKHWNTDLDTLIKKLGPLNGKNF